MNKNKKIFSLLVVCFLILACTVSNPFGTSPTQTPYIITATADSGQLINSPIPEMPTEQVQNGPTAEQPQPEPAATQTQQASPVNSVPYGPMGVMVNPEADGMVRIFDISGNQLGDITTPDFSGYGAGRIYAYGLDVNNVNSLQLYYYVYGVNAIRRVSNGLSTDLAAVTNFANFKGYANTPYFLVGTGMLGSGGLDTHLVTYDFSYGVDIHPIMDNVSMESHVYAPLLIKGSGGSPVSALYTTEAYGIGGDIIYPVTYGLYHLDLASGSVHWLFNDEYAPSSISPDGSIAAIVHRDASGIGGISIYDLGGPSEIVTYDLLMGQDRGAGYAVISPDNQKVAFMQAGGYMMAETPDFHSMLCYAHIGLGDVGTCLPANQLVVSTVAYPNYWAQPMGWLNNHELLYEAFTLQEPGHTLRVLDVDTGNVRDFAVGKFLGFIY
jgi:hypothetical protein